MDLVTVRKTVMVEAPCEHVFEVLTAQFNRWWPRSHHIGKCVAFDAVMEPRAGGRWYERGEDGSECEWGTVLEWHPPRRVLLTWNLDPDRRYDPDEATESEVTFTLESATRTRVDLEHRDLERFGERAAGLRDRLASEGGWSGLLHLMREHARSAHGRTGKSS